MQDNSKTKSEPLGKPKETKKGSGGRSGELHYSGTTPLSQFDRQVSSGYSNDPVMSKYDEYGFRGVVTKPYNINVLSKAVHGVLNDTDNINNH